MLYSNIDLIRLKIDGLKIEVNHRYPKKMFDKRSEEINNYIMGINHAMDIVNSLYARFVTGTFDEAPRMYSNRLEMYHDSADLF